MKFSRQTYLWAAILIGDGILTLVRPRRHPDHWHVGPAPWRGLMRTLSHTPPLARIVGAVQAALAIYIAARAIPHKALPAPAADPK